MNGPALRLKFFEDQSHCILEIARGDEQPKRIPACAWAKTGLLRDQVGQALHSARGALGKPGGECDLVRAHASLTAINKVGLDVLQQLFGRRISEVYDYFRAATPGGRNFAQRRIDFPIIQVQMPINFLQVEVLPFAELSELEPFRTDDDLMQTAARFPGFSFVTRRIVPGEIPQDSALQGSPRVPVKMFHHADFPGAEDEARALAHDFALDGRSPWPNAPGYTVAAAVQAMVDCDKGFDGLCKDITDQIHHFSCHSDRRARSHSLILKAAGHTSIRVPVSEFNGAMAIANKIAPKYSRPFAFLNACATNSPSTESLATWTDALLWAGYRGVIGTEAAAPDIFASMFSRVFYGEMIARRTVGQALQHAKWKMLKRWKNPMGLLYTLFGNPDLRIS